MRRDKGEDPWMRPRGGIWWTPTDPERRVPGTLRRSAAGSGLLTLQEALADPPSPHRHADPVALIRGTSMSGTEEFTLLDCRSVRSENIGYDLPGPRVQEFSALYTLEWCAIDDPDPAVTSIECRLDVLDVWGQPASCLEEKDALEPDGEGGYVTRLALRWPPPLTASTPIGDLAIHYPPDISVGFARSEYHRRVYLTVDLAEPVLMSRLFQDVLHPIRSFIAFATTTDPSFTSIGLTVSGNSADMSTSALWCACDPLDAKDERSPMDDGRAEDACRHGYFMLCQIEDSLSEVWSRWFDLQSQISGPIYTLLSAMDYHSGRHVTDLFQSMAFAAEAMHRALDYPVTSDVSKADAKQIRKRIREQLPPEQRSLEWLNSRIAHLTDVPYAARINSLLDQCPQVVRNAVGPEFAERVTRARNDAAHPNSTSRATGDELHRLYNLLILMLSACIMSEIGLAPEAVSSHVRYSDRFWELIRRGAIKATSSDEHETLSGVPAAT